MELKEEGSNREVPDETSVRIRIGVDCVGRDAAGAADQPAKSGRVTAIDVLLLPDAVMLEHAATNNARLLSVFPNGFALDATHRPHITLVQRFVRTADLEKLCAAVGRVLADAA